jgi:short-subunit dehydrogenase
MDLGLKGKRALVLAASRGLGYACARGLAQEGCDLVICSRDEARIQSAAAQIRQDTGARVEALAADVSNAAMADWRFSSTTRAGRRPDSSTCSTKRSGSRPSSRT